MEDRGAVMDPKCEDEAGACVARPSADYSLFL